MRRRSALHELLPAFIGQQLLLEQCFRAGDVCHCLFDGGLRLRDGGTALSDPRFLLAAVEPGKQGACLDAFAVVGVKLNEGAGGFEADLRDDLRFHSAEAEDLDRHVVFSPDDLHFNGLEEHCPRSASHD